MEFNKSNPGIKFAAGDQLQFFSTLRQRVDDYFVRNNLNPHANATMIFKTIILMVAYVTTYLLLILFLPSFWPGLLLWVLMGLALAGIGMSVMHDANHGAYSKSERVNRLMGYTLNMLGGTVLNWKMQHNVLHHTYTNITGMDEDIDSKLILKFSPHAQTRPVHQHQWYYAFALYSILTLYWGFGKDIVQFLHYRKAGLNKRSQSQNFWWLVRVSIMKLTYFSIFLVFPVLAGMPLYEVIIGFLVMHLLAGLILSVVFQLAHTVEETEFPLPDDKGQMQNSWAIHQMKTTMDFARNNKLLSWYIGGLNFQVEHHLFARICHVHYPEISKIVKETAHEFGIPYLEKKTFGAALRSHIRLLKKHGIPRLAEIGG